MNKPILFRAYCAAAALAVAASIAACGSGGSAGGGGGVGSGGGAATSTPGITLKGILADSPVSGIGYRTPTRSGTTNAAGEFSYVSGEQVIFSVGAVDLPAVRASSVVTPLEIAQTTDMSNQIASNILVFLQSLDADGNPANGISIPATAAAAATSSVDFNVTPAAFAANPIVTGIVANSGSNNKVLKSADVARMHFADTLSGTNGVTKINIAPVADGGQVQNVLIGATVALSGAASFDANGDFLSYAWTLISIPAGSAASLAFPTSAAPSFKADLAGTYVAALMVNDGALNSTVATVAVTAAAGNAAPVANAGAAQNVVAGKPVTLNGAASSDANRDPLTYAWTLAVKPAGSKASLTDPASAAPGFTPDLGGLYVATLVVNDGKLNSNVARVAVTATVGNAPPVANAGVAQSVATGTLVRLNGSASSDANGDTLKYAWTLSPPKDSKAVLTNPASVAPSFTADVEGTYVASLVVNDGEFNSTPATVAVTATAAPNVVPVANAGRDKSVLEGDTIALDGSASSDANGDKLTYAWTLSAPAGSKAALTNPASAAPSFTADKAGAYVASLVVSDGKLNSNTATVTLTVLAPGSNAPPVADPGLPQSVLKGATVQLDGSASSDANKNPLAFAWTLSVPTGSTAKLSDPASSKPIFTADAVGTYVATLIVNNGSVDSLPVTVAITITAGTVPPIAVAGADFLEVTVGSGSVSFDGIGSLTYNGAAPIYAWTLTSKPATSNANLTNATSRRPYFTADQPGDYTARLLVSDGTLSSPEAFVTIHAKSGNIAPVARAVINGSAPFYVTSPVYLDGSTSTDANNDPLTYSWTITLPDGSSKPLSGATPADATANFTPLALGTYVVSLIVDDGKGAANSKSSNVATVTLNAIAKPACTNPGQFILDSSGNLTFCR